MLKKLTLILSIFAFSAQSDLNAGQEGRFGKIRSKLYGLCWKTGPRKAATLISAFVVVYTLLAALHNKLYNFQDFFGTLIKQGTHPWEMCKLDRMLVDYVWNYHRRISKFESSIDAFFDSLKRMDITILEDGVEKESVPAQSDITKNYYDKYGKLSEESLKRLNELAALAINHNEKQKPQAEAFQNEYKKISSDFLHSFGNFKVKIKTQKKNVETMSRWPSCCASNKDEELS